MFAHVRSCLPTFTLVPMFTLAYFVFSISTRVYLSLLMFPYFNTFYSCMFIYVYHCLLVYVYLYLQIFTRVYLCIHLFTYVNPSLLVFTYSYLFLPMFTSVYFVYVCLNLTMFTRV